jgi:hypothetical protein
MGLLASASGDSPWAQDPEALLMFTFEVARDDPRLFDEVLDWMLVNESLLSVRRLRAMRIDEVDAALLGGVFAWLDRQRPRARLHNRNQVAGAPAATTEPLFRTTFPFIDLDGDFDSVGFARPLLLPSGKSRPPDLALPINLAFRLRTILGVGVRAEVTRLLLTIGAPRVTAKVLAQSARFAKRNLHEALTGLAAAGVVSALTIGTVQHYAADHVAWAALLRCEVGELPIHRDWPQLLGALRKVLRWLSDPELDTLSDYMRASRTRDLLEEIRPTLAFAGISVGAAP